MKLKGKNAISLIVLVITVIILSILAATVIISLNNTNIISKANDAVKKTEAQQIEEAKQLMYVDGMLGNSPEQQTIGDTILRWVESDQKVTAVGTKNVEKDGVTIPAGFGYVEGTKDTGLVIEDEDGNQFVWVPVEYTATGVIDENGLDTGFTAVFKRGEAKETPSGSGIYKMTGTLSTSYEEPYASGYATEKSEYYAMCKSVQEYGGFYIARFEAGDGDATYGTNGVKQGKRTDVTEAHTVVSKKGAYVYNFVVWGASMTDIGKSGAVYLSQNMYKDSSSVVSTLCYGVQWDAVMNFVSDAEHNIKNSVSWGNYADSTGDAATNSRSLQKTGTNEAWKAKNIYDLAGNVWEWTMESLSSVGRIGCGGRYDESGSDLPASIRDGDYPYDGRVFLGFRPTLYIVVE